MNKKFFLILLALAFLLSLGIGCAKKQVQEVQPEPKQEDQQVQETTQPEETKIEKKQEPEPPTPMELYELKYAKLPLQHEVVKGECLWWIAEYKKIYNDPFMWPLIYKANRDKINDPDLIYPGQVFYIPRNFELKQVKSSRKSAGAPAPYLPPQNANLPAQIRSKLGWGF